MQMMYDVVAKELKSMQIKDSHPRDYLNFFCLGKREEVSKEMFGGNDIPVIASEIYPFCSFRFLL